MSPVALDLLPLLARRKSRHAVDLASVICKLVVDGGKLGELDEVIVIGADGERRPIKRPPKIWFERLARAVAVGAFDRLTVEQIVERILSPPPAD